MAMVSIHSVNQTRSANAPVYWDGKFKFKKLPQGEYLVVVYVPRLGEFRQTQSVGPGTADGKGRVKLLIRVHPSRATRLYQPKDRFTVSVTKLSIPEKAYKEYGEARKKAAKGELDAAIVHLEKAVDLAPQFSAAWNNLGTIAYQQKKFELAEQHFREANKQDPESFEPIINLGGVMLNMEKYDEALKYNLEAVLKRPKDPLANSQLGMTYFVKKDFQLAIRYLSETSHLDPAHYSHPQLTLSEIYLRLGNRRAAAAQLENFLKHHPDYRQADQLRAAIQKLHR